MLKMENLEIHSREPAGDCGNWPVKESTYRMGSYKNVE